MISLRVHKELKSQQQDFFFKILVTCNPSQRAALPTQWAEKIITRYKLACLRQRINSWLISQQPHTEQVTAMTEGVSAREWELSQRKFLWVFFFLSKIQIKFKFQGWPPTSQSKTRIEGRVFIYWFSMKHEKIVKEASHSAIHLPNIKNKVPAL